MKYNLNTNSGIPISVAMKSYVENYVDSLADYLTPIYGDSLPVINTSFKKVKNSYYFEINIAGRQIFRTTAHTENFYDSVDKAFHRMKNTLRRHTQRIQDMRKRKNRINHDIPILIEKDDEAIIRRKEVKAVAMSQETAIYNLEKLDHDFFVYLDKETLEPCILYRRVSEGYGLLKVSQ